MCFFHRFRHKNPELLKKWVQAIRKKDWVPTQYSFICNQHFTESCFVFCPGKQGCRLMNIQYQLSFQDFQKFCRSLLQIENHQRKENVRKGKPLRNHLHWKLLDLLQKTILMQPLKFPQLLRLEPWQRSWKHSKKKIQWRYKIIKTWSRLYGRLCHGST